jgi:hypothetical protein
MILGGVIFFVIILVVVLSLYNKENQNMKKENNTTLKLLYTILIGIFMAVFVGVGIAAFYPSLKYPEAPISMKYGFSEPEKDGKVLEENKVEMEKYEKQQKDYQIKSQIYNRNVSIIALVFSIIIVVASLTFFKKILLIADGLLLGGVLTLLYSVIRGFGSDDNIFRFLVVSVGLIISLFLGYVKFIAPEKKR